MTPFEKALGPALDPTRWHLILLPTEKCNFRCSYCYEDFAIGRMPPAVVAGVKALIRHKAPALREMHLGWFGGEPLLGRTIVEEITGFAREEMEKVGQAAAFSSSMTTNGFLLDRATFEKLVGLGVSSYQISLDGDAEAHDRTRVRLGKRPSFDTIWRNLVELREAAATHFDILLRVHLTADNIPSVERLLDMIDATFGEDRRFRVALKPVGLYGKPGADHPRMLHGDDKHAALQRLQARVRRRPVSGIGAAEAVEAPVSICYAARPNSLVVRADGTLAKCTVAFADARNAIGRLREDGTLDITQDRLAAWLAPLSGNNRAHLGCPYTALSAPVGAPA
jgi:uncharacterized protein